MYAGSQDMIIVMGDLNANVGQEQHLAPISQLIGSPDNGVRPFIKKQHHNQQEVA